MGRKIFVSYKYNDSNVKFFTGFSEPYNQKARDYVDYLEKFFKLSSDHIYKGESDGEDLSGKSEYYIQSKLYDRIYDSTLTIVLISPGMKEPYKTEKNQWIPREISYSLSEYNRGGRISATNAVLAVVLPDYNGKYDYYITQKNCCDERCRFLNTASLFEILSKNMFNENIPNTKSCNSTLIYYGDYSYIQSVKWEDFIVIPEKYIDKAYEIQKNKEHYNITKQIPD